MTVRASFTRPYPKYAEICIQYGYLVMFAPVVPVCFLLAVFNNVFEIQGDLTKILYLGRRPVPKAAKDIGVWYYFLKLFTVMGCSTNAGILTIAVHKWKLVQGVFNVDSPRGDRTYDNNHMVGPAGGRAGTHCRHTSSARLTSNTGVNPMITMMFGALHPTCGQ